MNKKIKNQTYIVKFKNKRGDVISSEIDAPNLLSAQNIIKKRGKLLSIKKRGFSLWNFVKMTPSERQIFLRNLSTLLASGKGASDSLRAMEYSFGGMIKMVSAKMITKMEAGISMVDALEEVCAGHHIPETTISLIRAGERTGKTWKALADAAEFEREMESMRKNSNKDMYIAIAGFLFALALVIVTEFWVKAYFLNILEGLNISDNIETPIVDIASTVVLWSMIISGSIFILLLLLGTVGKKIFPFFADKIILKIPFFSSLILSRNNYITLYGMSLMVTSGVSMEKALSLSEESAKKGSLKTDLRNAVKSVKNGGQWSREMTTFHPVDRAALDGAVDKVQIAEILGHLAKNNRETYKDVVSTVGPLLQFLAATFIIVAGAVLFGHTMLPMLKASAQAFN